MRLRHHCKVPEFQPDGPLWLGAQADIKILEESLTLHSVLERSTSKDTTNRFGTRRVTVWSELCQNASRPQGYESVLLSSRIC